MGIVKLEWPLSRQSEFCVSLSVVLSVYGPWWQCSEDKPHRLFKWMRVLNSKRTGEPVTLVLTHFEWPRNSARNLNMETARSHEVFVSVSFFVPILCFGLLFECGTHSIHSVEKIGYSFGYSILRHTNDHRMFVAYTGWSSCWARAHTVETRAGAKICHFIRYRNYWNYAPN